VFLDKIDQTQAFGEVIKPSIILSTFTLWRDVCLSLCFTGIKAQSKIDDRALGMEEFTSRVDIGLLNERFKPLLFTHFKALILRDN
jgi:hypothetical protein